jgi:hypothetical protein
MSDVATLALLFLFIGSTEIIGSTENRGSKATGELAVTALVTSSVSITFHLMDDSPSLLQMHRPMKQV